MKSKMLEEYDMESDDIILNKKKQDQGDKLIQDKEKKTEVFDESVEIENTFSLGHLVPLTCGHNGSFKPQELEFYEYHLRKSKILET